MDEKGSEKDWQRVERGIYRRKDTPHLWISYSRGGKRYRESSTSDKITVARRLLRYREGEIAQGKVPALRVENIRFDELAADFIDDYKANNLKSLDRAGISKNHLARFFEGMKAADISTDQVKKYIVERQGKGASVATINRETSALKRMFSLAARSTPPKVRLIPHIPHLTEHNTRTGFLEREDFDALCGALQKYLRPLVVCAYFTGMRRGELIALTWDCLDLREGCITLKPGTTKSGEGRTVYLPDEPLRVLQDQKDERDQNYPDCPWVFHREGKRIGSFRKSWITGCKKVGLDGLFFHDLRRTGVRNLIRAGVSQTVAMRISGHKTDSIFRRYDIVSQEDLKEAARKQGAYMSHSSHSKPVLEKAEEIIENAQDIVSN